MFKENGMVYTDDEMIIRMWDKENILDTMARHAFYRGSGQRRREINELWVTKKDNRMTASMANNIGFFVGLDEVARHYVVDYDEYMKANLQRFREEAPEGQFGEQDYGVGMMSFHVSNTPLVILAGDGRTARYLGYDTGCQAQGHPDDTCSGQHILSLELAELIKEDGQWKIWHLVEEHDHCMEVGEAYAEKPILREKGNSVYEQVEFGDPTIKRDVYDPLYGWEYLYYDMPAAYYTYVESEGYGPNGKIGKLYYDRMV